MNDPNGLVHYEGEWHAFHQYNPFGNQWGHMSWNHALSPDLVHWDERGVALPEADGVMIFSGSAVVDARNTSGFGTDEGPTPLVAVYTGHCAADGMQSQCLAYSADRGRTWTKYPGNPVIGWEKDFRDPKVFWHAPTGKWVMVVVKADQKIVRFYGSPDLKRWTPLSTFGAAGTPVWARATGAAARAGSTSSARSTARRSATTTRPTRCSGKITARTTTRPSRGTASRVRTAGATGSAG
jgi:sucrose-6-phosphate hydrolase SacC (GH32 family)